MTHNMPCFTLALRPLTLHFPSGLRSTTIPTPRLLHLPRRASIAKARGSAQPQRTTSSCTSSPARCAARRPGRSCSSVSHLRAKQRPACGGGAHDRWPFQSLRWHRRLQYGVPHAHAQNDSSPQPSHLQRNAKGKGQLHTAHSTQHTAHSTQHTAHSTHHTAHITQHTAHSTQHTAHITQHTAHSTQHTAHSTQRTAHSTQHTAHSTQRTAHSTQHTAHSTQHTAHSTQHTAHSTQHTARTDAACPRESTRRCRSLTRTWHAMRNNTTMEPKQNQSKSAAAAGGTARGAGP
jgi:hypothetical protein